MVEEGNRRILRERLRARNCEMINFVESGEIAASLLAKYMGVQSK